MAIDKIKDKELTKRKLLNAVGEIIKEKGYTGLGINKIAKHAKVKFEQCSSETVEDFVTRLLLEQFDYLYNDKETQGLIHWEISEKNELLNSIARLRENKASQLFERIDKEIESTEIDFRSVSALLVAGIYYLNVSSG